MRNIFWELAIFLCALIACVNVNASEKLSRQISALRVSLESFNNAMTVKLDAMNGLLNGALADISAMERVLNATSRCSAIGAFYAPQSKKSNKQGCLDASFATFDDQLLKKNGYHMVGDLIIQWGVFNQNGQNQVYHKVKYPRLFPERVFNIQSSIGREYVVSGTNSTAIRNIRLKSFEITSDHSRQAAQEDIYWLAIGK